MKPGPSTRSGKSFTMSNRSDSTVKIHLLADTCGVVNLSSFPIAEGSKLTTPGFLFRCCEGLGVLPFLLSERMLLPIFHHL